MSLRICGNAFDSFFLYKPKLTRVGTRVLPMIFVLIRAVSCVHFAAAASSVGDFLS